MTLAELQFASMAMGLVGGLAIFLFGMELMTDALKAVAGDGVRTLLARLTTNRFKAVFAGGFTTAVIQSSSVTTVLTVGFVSAGLLSLQQSVGIILGASIGTTVTAQIIAFQITKLALAIVALGFLLKFAFRNERVRQYGVMLLGFGLLFLGMNLMREAMQPLRLDGPFLDMMRGMDAPLLGFLVGAAFTALVQSSSATTGVILVLGSSGVLSLEGAIALVLGANVGTCVTALLAAIGRPRVALQTALVHVTFNVAGAMLWLFFIPELADFVRSLTEDTARQIANAHTAFNVANTLVFLAFPAVLVRLVEWIAPARTEIMPGPLRPKYLDDNLVPTPALALDRVAMEMNRLGKRVVAITRAAPEAILGGTDRDLHALERMDDDVDALHSAIIAHLALLSGRPLAAEDAERVHASLTLANYLESIADVVETNLVSVGLRRTRHHVRISPGTREMFQKLIERVLWAVEQAACAVRTCDPDTARDVIRAKADVTQLADRANARLMQRLGAHEDHRLDAFRVESELVESLKRVYYLAKRVARVVVEGRWPRHAHMEATSTAGDAASAAPYTPDRDTGNDVSTGLPPQASDR